MSQAAISVTNITKKFHLWDERPKDLKKLLISLLQGKLQLGQKQERTVLEDVSFEIYPGEFVGIMGRNGAGKSTILKLISGIYAPSSGSIQINGKIAPLLELGAGFHEELSGYENIFLNAAILGFGRRQTLQKLDEIIDFSELREFIHTPVRKYSSGMLVRLGFSIAVHLDAPILLFDEVLAVGDAGFQEKSLRKIESLHQEGRTIVLVTHDPSAVRNHCSRAIVIDHHRKIFDGPAREGTEVYLDQFRTTTA